MTNKLQGYWRRVVMGHSYIFVNVYISNSLNIQGPWENLEVRVNLDYTIRPCVEKQTIKIRGGVFYHFYHVYFTWLCFFN